MPWSRSSPGDRPSRRARERRSSRSGGRGARPNGSRSSVSTAACSPETRSPTGSGSTAAPRAGSSGTCWTGGWRPKTGLRAGRSAGSAARAVYRALGAEDIRHRRIASAEVLLRRLLSLDYVIGHTGLPWLPTEPEKVGAFEGLGLDRRVLPVPRVPGRRRRTRGATSPSSTAV